MLKQNFSHLQIGSYSLDSCSKFLKGLNIRFIVDCFFSYQKINHSKSLGIPKDSGHNFSR